MKKRILAIMLASVMATGVASISMPAFATPDNQQLSETRQKYAEIEQKIASIEDKIYELNAQIEPLQVTVDNNKREITNINNTIDTTTKDIEKCKKEINELDLALGQRVKAIYQSGELEFSYLNFLFESESTSDFFSRIEKVSKIIGKDKTAITTIMEKKDELNNKITSLEEKKNEIDKLNKEVEASLSELDTKKKEQQVLADSAKEERSKFDAEYLSIIEREVVQPQYDVIANSNSTSESLKAAISQLRNIRDNQIKSSIVTSEINDKIERAKTLVEQKEAAERRAAEQAAAANRVTVSRGSSGSSAPAPASGSASAILNEAYKHLGKPYVYGASGPSNFDCSGFTEYVYNKAAGIDISRTTYSQINVGTPVSRDNLQPGDLVFPHTGHVGIYIGNGQMIHAPQTGDVVKVSPVYKFYAGRRIV